MAQVRLQVRAREAFFTALNAMLSAHQAVDRVIAELDARAPNDRLPLDRLVILLSRDMATWRAEIAANRNVPGLLEAARAAYGDQAYDFGAALDETTSRINALIAAIRTNVPSTTQGGKQFVHLWEIKTNGDLEMNSLTKQQVETAIRALLDGFVADRVNP